MLIVVLRTTDGTPAASAATRGPNNIPSVSTAEAGLRSISSRTSTANAAAGPTARLSRMAGKPWTQSGMKRVSRDRAAR